VQIELAVPAPHPDRPLYSVCTGLSALSRGVIDFSLSLHYWAWASAVSLDSPWLSSPIPCRIRARPHAWARFRRSPRSQCDGGLIAVLVGYLETTSITPGSGLALHVPDRRSARVSLRLHSNPS